MSRNTVLHWALLILTITGIVACTEPERKSLLQDILEFDQKEPEEQPIADTTGWVGDWSIDVIDGLTFCEAFAEDDNFVEFDSFTLTSKWTFNPDGTWAMALVMAFGVDDIDATIDMTSAGFYSLENSSYEVIPDNYDFFDSDDTGTWERVGDRLTLTSQDGTVTVLKPYDPNPVVCTFDRDQDVDTTPPEITKVVVYRKDYEIFDRHTDVNPVDINANGIDIYFSETLAAGGRVTIQRADGLALEWETELWGPDFSNDIIWLYFYNLNDEQVGLHPLEFETVYEVLISVQDLAGNKLETTFVFTTKGLE